MEKTGLKIFYHQKKMVNVQLDEWIWHIWLSVNVVTNSKWTYHVSFDNLGTRY